MPSFLKVCPNGIQKIRVAGILLLLLFLLINPEASVAQRVKVSDSIPTKPDSIAEKEHSPKKAALMSAVLPGLGQLYNKRYWKIPVIYAGFGIMTYFIVSNASEYMDYQSAYIEKTNGDTLGNYAYLVNRYTEDELLSAREYYRRNLEISILITAVWYSINILDATVDAHLRTFNVSKDLSLKVKPALLPTGKIFEPAPGISLCFKFK